MMKTTKDCKTPSGTVDDHLLEALRRCCVRSIKGLRLAILFGSCSRGAARTDSDIDLAVLADKPITVRERERVIEGVALETGRPVDLVDLYGVGEPLLNQVLTTGVRLIGRNGDYAQLMMRNVVANADFVPLQQRLLKERLEAWIRR